MKDSSFVRIRNAGWVKEKENEFIFSSKLSLVVLNALSQEFHWDIDVISVHLDIFREELEIIEGCGIEFFPSKGGKPKVRLVKTEIPVNLASTRNQQNINQMKKALQILKQYHILIRNSGIELVDIAFLRYNLIHLGNLINSQGKEANKELEEYVGTRQNEQEIKNLRHNYFNNPKSNWNKIPMKDPQNALYDEHYFFEEKPKVALIYGTPRFIFKGFAKEELEHFNSLKSGVMLPPKEYEKDFF